MLGRGCRGVRAVGWAVGSLGHGGGECKGNKGITADSGQRDIMKTGFQKSQGCSCACPKRRDWSFLPCRKQ